MAMHESLILVILSCLCITFSYLVISDAEAESDALRQGQLFRDWDHLTSAGGVFVFGFFTRTFKSEYPSFYSEPISYRYLGIWYTDLPKQPVWVANRKNPVPDSSGVVTLDTNGILRLTSSGWGHALNISCNNSSNNNRVTAAVTLLDSGNLIVRQVVYTSNRSSSFGPVMWQSFDCPTNILLPGMKLGMNLKTGQSWFLTSWLSDQLPALGDFKLGVDGGSSNPQLVMWRRGHVYWTSGPWINGSFANATFLTEFMRGFLEYKFVTSEDEKYFSYFYKSNSDPPTLELGLEGQIEIANSNDFGINNQILSTPCDQNVEVVCLKQDPSICRNGSEQFVPTLVYFPPEDMAHSSSWESDNMSLALTDCDALCWNNCSCFAYGSTFPNGTGCRFWESVWDYLIRFDETSQDTIYILSTPGDAKGDSLLENGCF